MLSVLMIVFASAVCSGGYPLASTSAAATNPATSAPTLDLAASSDSGTSSTDDITNIAAPTLNGSAQADSTVKVYDGNELLGQSTANIGTPDASGNKGWSFAPSGTLSEGDHSISATATDASGNTSAASDTLKVTIDTGAPVAQAPVEVLVSSGNVSTAPTVPVKASWSASDAGGSGVSSYELQRSKDGGAFSALPPDATPTSKIANYQPVSSYQLRVRATDVAGNQSGWAAGPQFSVNLYQEDAAGVAYPSGVWTAEALSTALGGGVKYSGASGSKATFTFTGRQVGWVTNLDTNRGKAEVWVDGTRNKSSDLYRSASTPRVMTFVQDFGTTGTHTLEVRVLGTKNPASSGTRVDVDAFVVLN